MRVQAVYMLVNTSR